MADRATPGRTRLYALLVALGAAAAVTGVQQVWPEPGRRLTATQVTRSVLIDPGAPAVGAARPEVTVVVFTDYLCAICKRTDPALGRLAAADPTVRVIYKDWPIRGPMADFAARTALAAHAQGRYVAVHDALMAARGELTPARIDAIAGAAGADLARLAAARASPQVDARIGKHSLQAFGLGLRGTPSYIVGPYLLEGGLDDRRLAQAVRAARRAGPLIR